MIIIIIMNYIHTHIIIEMFIHIEINIHTHTHTHTHSIGTDGYHCAGNNQNMIDTHTHTHTHTSLTHLGNQSVRPTDRMSVFSDILSRARNTPVVRMVYGPTSMVVCEIVRETVDSLPPPDTKRILKPPTDRHTHTHTHTYVYT
eukprot:GHVR01129685.1.p1 GENE.GHVR01129685.1~~GHVR01129685.1.p1  ORF type:complete len:144 (+),score=92.55 GHVR01129685.1:75-506(+)